MPSSTSETLSAEWQLGCSGVRERSACLLSRGVWSDCWLAAGVRRERVAAHRVLLAMASSVFEAMLFGPLAKQGDCIALPDTEPDTLKALLEYIYTDEVNVKSCEMAYKLHIAAQRFKLPHLRARCVALVLARLSPRNACASLEFAERAQEEELKIKCFEMIKSNTSEALTAKCFERLHIDTVEKIFSAHTLSICSELELFRAAERYARARGEAAEGAPSLAEICIKNEVKPNWPKIKMEPCEANDADNSTQDDKKFQEKAEKAQPIRRLIKQIRYLALRPQEFSQHDFSSLLSVFEINAIALNLISDRTHTPMPSGFSTSRIHRNQAAGTAAKVASVGTTATDAKKPASQPAVKKEAKEADAFWIHPKPLTDQTNRVQNRHFHIKILDVKYLLGSSTHMFDMHNMSWTFDVNPWASYYRKKRGNTLGVFVTCHPKDGGAVWSCQAKLIVRIISHKSRTRPYRVERVTQFGNGHNCHGWNNIIPLSELMDPAHGYVSRGAITLHVHVRASAPVIC